MSQLFLYLFLSFSLVGFAQNDTVSIEIYPNPFDLLAVHIIHINEVDQLAINLHDGTGKSIFSVPRKAYFKSTQFSENLNFTPVGIYFSFFEVNEDKIIRKLVHLGNDSALTLNYDIRIDPSKFQKETLKIFPYPNITDNLTIETETENSEVQYTTLNTNW